MKLTFSDGMEFDLSGPIRKELRSDGLYVVGEGKLIPVQDEEDAKRILRILREDEGVSVLEDKKLI